MRIRWWLRHWDRLWRGWLLSRWYSSHGGLLLLVKAFELRDLAFGILPVDLHSTGDEELLFLCRARLPIVWLCDCDGEPCAACPLPVLCLSFALRWKRRVEGFDRRELLHIPSLTYTKAPIVILTRLVHSHSSSRSHRNDNQAGLFIGLGAVRRRRCGGMRGIFVDSNVGDIRLGELAALVDLGEA